MAKLGNRVKVATATTGTGTVTLGAASSNAFCTFAEAGILNAETVAYCIEEGTDFEIGTGSYTSSGTTLSRASVTLSKIGGTAGTSKMNLAGAATVRIVARKEDIGNLTEDNIWSGSQTYLGSAVGFQPVNFEGTDAGATFGPVSRLFRNSASPLAGDQMGDYRFSGKDSGGNTEIYASIYAQIGDPTDTSEDGLIAFRTVVAGTLAARLWLGAGLYTNGGVDKGVDTINAHAGLYDTAFRVGAVKLAEGTASAAATIDIVMTAWTAYRHISIVLAELIPATDAAALWCRFSTNGGSSYDATGYNYAGRTLTDADTNATVVSSSANQIAMTLGAAATGIGNGATEGIGIEVHLYGRTSTALWGRITWSGYYINSAATPLGMHTTGGGSREAAQDTDAIQFLMASGNLSGKYTVYGWL